MSIVDKIKLILVGSEKPGFQAVHSEDSNGLHIKTFRILSQKILRWLKIRRKFWPAACKSACKFDLGSAPIPRVSYWSLASRWVNPIIASILTGIGSSGLFQWLADAARAKRPSSSQGA